MNSYNLSVLCLILVYFHVHGYRVFNPILRPNFNQLHSTDSNIDMFGGSNSPAAETKKAPNSSPSVKVGADIYKDEAAKLRKEALEMEVSLREEARAKGLPEEVINKLIPIPGSKPVSNIVTKEVVNKKTYEASEIRSKLGYLNVGDPVRMTSQLAKVKASGIISIWNSKDLSQSNFKVNDNQLKSKTNIDATKLKLDDVGYDYQKVFIGALVIATVFGVSSSFVGGELGFVLGYLSALFPIGLVGVGSIAPALVGDVLNRIKYLTNEEAKKKYITSNAGKFLVGYTLGLPIQTYSAGSISNTVEFFQIRPEVSNSQKEVKQMFAKTKFEQNDIARSSAVCLASSVAECIEFGEASGSNPAEVNTLYELINAVDPPMVKDNIQNHVRWSAVTAYEILDSRKIEFKKLIEAFGNGVALEECIAIIEGKND